MRILQITPYYLPHTGGIERYVYNLSKYLVKNGHQVEIHTSNIPKAPNYEEIDGIVIRRFQSLCSPLRNPMVPRFFFPSLNELQDFDLIHAHMIYSSAALYAIKLKRRLGIPLLFTHHGCMRFENLLRDSIVKMYDRVMIPGILSEADGVIALSQEDLEFLGEFGDRNNITIIPNGLDTETIEMSLLQSNNASHDTYKFQKNILFVGRLVPIKGTEYLLKSIKIISQDLRNYGVRIIIIGDGPQLLELKQFVFNNKIDDLVTFTGQITETQKLIDYYQKSQIIVIPSISEGFPSTVLEAMYFGVPIISTDLLVMRQYFSDAVILVPPKDPERLGNAILTLVQNPDFCEKLSKIGKETVLNEFRWDKLIYRFLAEYDILLSKSSNTMHYSFKM